VLFRQGCLSSKIPKSVRARGTPRTYRCHVLKNFGACLLPVSFKKYVRYHGCRGTVPNQSFKADGYAAA
jgi:hypothetical protein